MNESVWHVMILGDFPARPSVRARSSDVNRLTDLLAGLATEEGAQPSRLHDVRLLRHTSPKPCAPYVYEPSIIFVAQGLKTSYLGDDVYTYDTRKFLVLSVPLPLECEVVEASPERPFLGLSLQVNPVMVGELLAEIDDLPAGATVPRGMYSAPFTQALRGAVVRLVECLGSSPDCRILGPGIVREIIYRVLCDESGGALQAAAARHSQFGQISKALRRIHAEYAQALDVASLAREARMGLSTFHHQFKTITSTSPLQYLKKIRLHKARLLMAQGGVSASAAAGKVGYESPSQFSREFKRLFKKSPLEAAGRKKAGRGRGAP